MDIVVRIYMGKGLVIGIDLIDPAFLISVLLLAIKQHLSEQLLVYDADRGPILIIKCYFKV